MRGRAASIRTRCWPPIPTGRTPRSGRRPSRWRRRCAARSQAGRPADQAWDHRGVLPGAQHHRHPRTHPRGQIHAHGAGTTATPSWAAAPRAGWWSTTTRYAYSHHATDPAGGQLCNAFDLVRPLTCSRRAARPRTARMWATEGLRPPDAGVRRAGRGHPPQAYARSAGAGRAGVWRSGRAGAQPAQDENWQEKLEVDKQGRVKDTLGNLALILRNDPGPGHRLPTSTAAASTSAGTPRATAPSRGRPSKRGWNESDLGALQIYLEHVYGLYTPVQAQRASCWPSRRSGATIPSATHRIPARVGRRAARGPVRGLSGRGGYGLYPRGCEEDDGGGGGAGVPAGNQI